MAGALLSFDLQRVIARIIAIASFVDTLGQAELLIEMTTRIESRCTCRRSAQFGSSAAWFTLGLTNK